MRLFRSVCRCTLPGSLREFSVLPVLSDHFLRIHLSTSVYVLPGSEHPGRRSYVPFSITLKCLVYNDFPFKKMPHAKSAKSTPTTVLYGIFSSENSFPCTVICNAYQYEIACRREHLCQAYGCAKTYLEHDFRDIKLIPL